MRLSEFCPLPCDAALISTSDTTSDTLSKREWIHATGHLAHFSIPDNQICKVLTICNQLYNDSLRIVAHHISSQPKLGKCINKQFLIRLP